MKANLIKPATLAATLCLALGSTWAQSDTTGTAGSSGASTSNSTSDSGATSSNIAGGGAGMSADTGTVRAVQQQLKDKGLDVGEADGVLGPKTQAALKSFQQSQGMQPSGQLDQATLSALGVQGTTGADTSSSGSGSGNGSNSTPPAGSSGSSGSSGSGTSGSNSGSAGSGTSGTGTMPKQ